MRYSVELRSYTECGDDYIEEHYSFDTRTEAIMFARVNRSKVYSVQDYQDRDYDPVDISWK